MRRLLWLTFGILLAAAGSAIATGSTPPGLPWVTATKQSKIKTNPSSAAAADASLLLDASSAGSGECMIGVDTATDVCLIDAEGDAAAASMAVVGTSSAATLSATTALTLEETGAGVDAITIRAPSSIVAQYTLELPADAGSAGECLQNTGTPGVLDFGACATGTGDITAVGSMTSGAVFADSTADDDWIGLGSGAGRIEFDDQATDEVNILDANVGIGLSNPINALSVSRSDSATTLSSATAMVSMRNPDVTNNSWSTFSLQTHNISGNPVAVGRIATQNTDHTDGSLDSDLVFTNITNSVENEVVRFRSTGPIEINGSPEISGDTLIEGTSKLSFNSSGNEYINSPTAGEVYFANRGTFNFYADTNNNDGNIPEFVWHTGETAGGTSSIKAVLMQGGNFGIGDTTPAALLTVGASDAFQVDASGNITTAGDVAVNGGDLTCASACNIAATSATVTIGGTTSTTIGDSTSYTSVSGLRAKVREVSGTTTLDGNDKNVICDTSGGAATLTMPSAANTGQELTIVRKGSDANACNIARAGSDTITLTGAGTGQTNINIGGGSVDSRTCFADGGTIWYCHVN